MSSSGAGRKSSLNEEKSHKESIETPVERRTRETREARTARAEVAVAEEKVALGIQYLYDLHKNEAKFDAQNIATLTLSASQLNTEVSTRFGNCRLGDLFPNKLENGVTLHLFGEHYIPHPPANYMIQQKISSLCEAASRPPFSLNPTFTQGLEKLYARLANNRLNTLVYEIYGADGVARSTPAQEKQFHEGVDHLIRQYAEEAVQKLQQEAQKHLLEDKAVQQTVDSYALFSKALLNNSSHHRSDTHDILTFNLATNHFSYDEAANITAHDRTLDTGCANLSLVFEGRFKQTERDAAATVVSSTVKHASPVAIDSIGKANKTDLLIDTYRNMEDVIRAMVRLRLHGRTAATRDNPLAINWVYQMLTTNAFNLDNQAEAYQLVTHAARLLNHSTRQIDGVNVNLDVAVMNAGINKIAEVGSGGQFMAYMSKMIPKNKSDTQRRENRQAYMQLSEAVSSLAIADSHPRGVIETFNSLKICLQPEQTSSTDPVKEAYAKLEALRAQIAANSNDMYNCNETLRNLNAARTQANAPDLIDKQIEAIKKSVATLDDKAEKLFDDIRKQTDVIEKHERSRWIVRDSVTRSCITTLSNYIQTSTELQQRLANPVARDDTLRDLLSITALIYKTYANQLYYGDGTKKYEEVYRNPEKAALFNAYLVTYQRLTGMMASFGCKSANDRTLVLRELIAALSHLSQQTPPTTPRAYHLDSLPQTQLSTLISSFIMSNSALYSAINDTSGATAKVDSGKFPFLSGVKNIDLIGDFGENYAAHKMKMKEPKSMSPEITRPRANATASAVELASQSKAYVSPTQTPPSSSVSSSSVSSQSSPDELTPPSENSPRSRSRR
jgi:hypothetical protein